MLGALLESARPPAVDERELALALPAEAAFYKRKAEQDDYRRTTAEAVRNVTGMALTLRYELADAAPERRRSSRAERGPMSERSWFRRSWTNSDAEEIVEDDQEGES